LPLIYFVFLGGVKLNIANSEGELIRMGNGFGHDTIDINKCKEFFENNSAPKPSNSR